MVGTHDVTVKDKTTTFVKLDNAGVVTWWKLTTVIQGRVARDPRGGHQG